MNSELHTTRQEVLHTPSTNGAARRLRDAQRQRRWRKANPERAQATRLRWLQQRGVRPIGVANAERRALALARDKKLVPKIQRCLDAGLSYTAAATKVGLTKNAAIGLMHRAAARARSNQEGGDHG